MNRIGDSKNKLGLARQICTQGLWNLVLCNGDELENGLRDIREYIKFFDGLCNPIKAVTFISYAKHGAFVVSFAPLTDNPGNYRAVWLYVPNSIKIQGDQLAEACDKAKQCLLSDSLQGLKDDALFSKGYDLKEYCFDYTPYSGNGQYGFFFTERYTLTEILGNYLYQEHFSKYDAVFLLEKAEGITIKEEYANKVIDLSKEELEKYYVLHSPILEKKPKINLNGTSFCTGEKRVVKEGDKLEFCLLRDGFEEERVTIKVDEKSIKPEEIKKQLNDVTWNRKITREMFVFKDEKGQQIRDSIKLIKVNGKNVGNGVLLTEEEWKDAMIEIDTDKYELMKAQPTHNLSNGKKEVSLKKKVREFKSKIILANGHEAEMTLVSREMEDDYIVKKQSPLEWYSFEINPRKDDKEGKLIPFQWKAYGKGALAVLVIEIGILCCYVVGGLCSNYWSEHEIQWGWPPKVVAKGAENNNMPTLPDEKEKEKSEGKELARVVAYLDGDGKWNKDSLEQYNATQGLFDALNTFDDKEVKRIHEEVLSSQSKNLQNIISAFSQHTGKNFGKGKEKHNVCYNGDGDNEITIERYIDWLNNHSEPSPEPSKMGDRNSDKLGSAEKQLISEEETKKENHRKIEE